MKLKEFFNSQVNAQQMKTLLQERQEKMPMHQNIMETNTISPSQQQQPHQSSQLSALVFDHAKKDELRLEDVRSELYNLDQ